MQRRQSDVEKVYYMDSGTGSASGAHSTAKLLRDNEQQAQAHKHASIVRKVVKQATHKDNIIAQVSQTNKQIKQLIEPYKDSILKTKVEQTATMSDKSNTQLLVKKFKV